MHWEGQFLSKPKAVLQHLAKGLLNLLTHLCFGSFPNWAGHFQELFPGRGIEGYFLFHSKSSSDPLAKEVLTCPQSCAARGRISTCELVVLRT